MFEIREVLKQYLDGKKKIEDLETWANLIECRDDIEFDIQNAVKIKTIIHKLANSEINGHVNTETIKEWLLD